MKLRRRIAAFLRLGTTPKICSQLKLSKQKFAITETGFKVILRSSNLRLTMSLMGQSRSYRDVGSMSGLLESGHDWAIYEYTRPNLIHGSQAAPWGLDEKFPKK
jgi:hypothetical protein